MQQNKYTGYFILIATLLSILFYYIGKSATNFSGIVIPFTIGFFIFLFIEIAFLATLFISHALTKYILLKIQSKQSNNPISSVSDYNPITNVPYILNRSINTLNKYKEEDTIEKWKLDHLLDPINIIGNMTEIQFRKWLRTDKYGTDTGKYDDELLRKIYFKIEDIEELQDKADIILSILKNKQ